MLKWNHNTLTMTRKSFKVLGVDLEAYNYTYPDKLVALSPAKPRESARLLVYNRKTGAKENTTFSKIGNFLSPNSVLVFNQSKVVFSRVRVQKETGGFSELLFTSFTGNHAFALCDKFLNTDSVLRVPGTKVAFIVQGKQGMEYELKLVKTHNWQNFFLKYGQVPLPPYLKKTSLSQSRLKKEYQTIFAKAQGSVAAPTAGLHFSKRLLQSLVKQGFRIEYVTLHVGLGTFAKITEENLKTGKLHKETYFIDKHTAKRLEQYKKEGRSIVAVGTTSVRTLESASSGQGKLVRLSGDTEIFIKPPYSFKFVDCLITNFHVPKSSLMMLVASMVGRENLMKLYKFAVRNKYRLFSFGDGMLIK